MFEKYYKQHLSKRLLGDRSQSEDIERKVIYIYIHTHTHSEKLKNKRLLGDRSHETKYSLNSLSS